MTSTAAADIPVFTLNNGKKMPSVGIGSVGFLCSYGTLTNSQIVSCWFGQPGGGEAAENMIKNALKVRYTCCKVSYFIERRLARIQTY